MTTCAISTSSPVGWIAITGAFFEFDYHRLLRRLDGDGDFRGHSSGVKRTAVWVSFASTIALAFG